MRVRSARHLNWLLTPQAEVPPAATFLDGARLQEAEEKPAKLPEGFSGHDYAVFLLHTAAEIEHVLMVQYLYGAYSLGGHGVPEEHRGCVRAWQETILGIAKEEMGHLVTVQNLLRLIGGPLNLDRSDTPWDLPFYPFTFSLEPLSRASLARYVYTESPKDWPSDISKEEREEIEGLACEGEGRPVERVGVLYELMERVLGDADLVPEELFQAETLPFQASWDEWGRGYRKGARGGSVTAKSDTPDLIIGTAFSRKTAIDALKAVAEQGEAADEDPNTDEQSHFRRFLKIFREFPKDDAGWSPVLPVTTNPRATGGPDPVPDTTFIADPHSRKLGLLFNLRYRMLLTYLSHAFRLSNAGGRAPDVMARGMIVHRTFGEMYNLRAIAKLLVRMPLGSPDGVARAGPPFEMPYAVKLPFPEGDCWRLHLDLLEASGRLIRELETYPDDQLRAYLSGLAGIDRETTAAIERILGVCHSQGARLLPERSPA